MQQGQGQLGVVGLLECPAADGEGRGEISPLGRLVDGGERRECPGLLGLLRRDRPLQVHPGLAYAAETGVKPAG